MKMVDLLREAAAMEPDIPVALIHSNGRVQGIIGPMVGDEQEMVQVSTSYLWDANADGGARYWIDSDKAPTWVRIDSIITFKYEED